MLYTLLMVLLLAQNGTHDLARNGIWYATVASPTGTPCRVEIGMTYNGPTDVRAAIYLPWQGVNIPDATVTPIGDTWRISSEDGRYTFTGNVSIETGRLEGIWTDGTTRVPIHMRKRKAWPQDPEKRLPDPVALQGIDRSSSAAAEAFLFQHDSIATENRPLCVIIPELEASDIDGTTPSHHTPYRTITRHLLDKGQDVLCIVPAGKGLKPKGLPDRVVEHSIENYAAAIHACIQRARASAPTRPIVVVGHGDGGRTALLVAERCGARGVICLNTPSVSGRETIMHGIRSRDSALTVPASITDVSVAVMSTLLDTVTAHGPADIAHLPDVMESTVETLMRKHQGKQNRYGVFAPYRRANARPYISTIVIPWLQWYASFGAMHKEPLTTLPILWVTSENDVVVPEQCSAMPWTGAANVQTIHMSNTTHWLQACRECDVDEAESTPTSVNPQLIKIMDEWLAGLGQLDIIRSGR